MILLPLDRCKCGSSLFVDWHPLKGAKGMVVCGLCGSREVVPCYHHTLYLKSGVVKSGNFTYECECGFELKYCYLYFVRL